MYPESVIERFRAVDALAKRGAPGERDNAQRIVAKMEADFPHIRYYAFPPSPETETVDWSESPRARTVKNDRFDRWREAASGAFSWMSEVAGEIVAAKVARDVADEVCELQIKWLPSGKWQMALRLSADELAWASQNLTPFQKTEFVRHVADLMSQELREALDEG